MRSHHRVIVLVPLLLGCRPIADGGTSQTSTGTSSDSPGESEDSSESDDATSTGLGFVPSFDIPKSECDPFAQDCPDGEKCVPYVSQSGGTWDLDKCVPVLGDHEPGEPCQSDGVVEATDDCDATSFCWEVIADGTGTCAPFCWGTVDDPQCPDAVACLGYGCVINSSVTINLCLPTCDPLVQDCGEGLGCYWANDNFACVFTTRDRPIGSPCGFINDCAAGADCVAAEYLPACAGSGCCAPFCDAAAITDPCPELLAGTSCVALEEPNLPDCAIGRCLAPP